MLKLVIIGIEQKAINIMKINQLKIVYAVTAADKL